MNLAKIIIDTLKDYDYKTVSPKQMRSLVKGQLPLGLCATYENGRGNILVLRRPFGGYEMTQLHEIAHAYYNRLGVDASEAQVEATARDWQRMLYGVGG